MLPERLCDDFPEITVPLEPYTEDFAGVLAQILRPNVYGYSLDAPNIAYVGGNPMLIQNPHEPGCDEHAYEERVKAAEALEGHPALLRLAELETLRELAKNGNARLYLGFDRNGLRPNATLGEHNDS